MRENKYLVTFLVAIIAVGIGYMFFFNGSSESYRDPDANAMSSVDSVNLGIEDMDSVAVMQGLPDEEKTEKEAEEATMATGVADPLAPATDMTAEPSASAAPVPAAPVAEPEPTVKKVKTKKVIEDIKTGPSEEATISE